MSIISASHVSKTYGAVNALNDLSFAVESGECFGLLGPNGAGKSTMIKMIYGVLKRTGGDLTVLGLDPSTHAKELRRSIGVVLQEDALDEAMSVGENMLMFCQFHGIPAATSRARVSELLGFMSLESRFHDRISSLSGGMRRRLAFVRSLLPNPKLLILDEPTTGLDPAVRQLLWDKIQDLKEAGTTILLTTHYMDEAELLCDRIVVVDQGQIRAEGAPRSLIRSHCLGFVAHLETQGVRARVEAATLEDIATLVQAQNKKASMVRPSNLEDVFLKLTGKNLGN